MTLARRFVTPLTLAWRDQPPLTFTGQCARMLRLMLREGAAGVTVRMAVIEGIGQPTARVWGIRTAFADNGVILTPWQTTAGGARIVRYTLNPDVCVVEGAR